MEEIWRTFKNCEISNLGRINRIFANHNQKLGITNGFNNGKHKSIEIDKESFFVHRLVWTLFNGEIPNGYAVHHKNFNGFDNRLENLELLPISEHASLHNKGVSHRTNYSHSEETKTKISLAHKGKHLSEETKQKISLAQKGKSSKFKGIPNKSAMKQVYQYDKNFNLIAIFESATQAGESYKIHPSSIIKTCNGKHKTCQGFIWSYSPLSPSN